MQVLNDVTSCVQVCVMHVKLVSDKKLKRTQKRKYF